MNRQELTRVAGATARTITDSDHVRTAQELRATFQLPRPVVVADELNRDLADYDTTFGVHLADEQVSV